MADQPFDDSDAPERESRYRRLLHRTLAEWDRLDAAGDPSVRPSAQVTRSITEAVRNEVRRGRQVTMPTTAHGPFSVSESALRTIVRDAVDGTPGARLLRTEIDHVPAEASDARALGAPSDIRCRITASAHAGVPLTQFGAAVRDAVDQALQHHFGVAVAHISIHIEDLHDD